MGPMGHSTLAPQQLFEQHIVNTLPTFSVSTPYVVHLDPLFPYHLRITLPSVADAMALVAAWGTGFHTVGMKLIDLDGSGEPDHDQRGAASRGRGKYRGIGSGRR